MCRRIRRRFFETAALRTGDRITIGLSSWIIRDGNYGDFAVGKQYSFALEFYPLAPLVPLDSYQNDTPRHVHKGDANYSVFGKCVYSEGNWWVMDIGVPVFRDMAGSTSPKPGESFRGNVYVGIDPFFYFERLSRGPGAPSLIFDWHLDKIEIQTAPFVEISERVWVRDESKNNWLPLDSATRPGHQ